MEFRPFVDFVNFMGWGLDPSWDPSTLNKFLTLVGSVHVVDWSLDPSWDPSTLWTCLMTLVIGSVHIVDWSLDPSWGSSNLWTCLNFRPLPLGSSTDSSNLIVVITHSIV